MTDQNGCKLIERQETLVAALVAQTDAPMIVEPSQRALDKVSCFSQARAVRLVHRPGQERPNAALACCEDIVLPAVGAVALVDVGAEPWPATRALHRLNGVECWIATFPSGTFAGVVSKVNGNPHASVIKWRLQPFLPRSVGFGPV